MPVLGICYGLQEMSRFHGAEVAGSDHREYGKAVVTVQRDHTEEAKKGGFEIGTHVDQFSEGVEGDFPVRDYNSRFSEAIMLKLTLLPLYFPTGLDVTFRHC